MPKKNLRTFIPFVILVAIWSFFFASFKFFLWNDFQFSLKIDLQTIAGYLSLGAALSYFIGGSFAYAFLKKYFLIYLSLSVASILGLIFLFGLGNKIIFAITIIIVGFLYGLWTVMKNVMTSIEIEKTGYSDTFVSAMAGIVFIVFIIFGSIFGNYLFNHASKFGYLFFVGLLLVGFAVSHFLDYDNIRQSHLMKDGLSPYIKEKKRKVYGALSAYLPELKYIIKNYIPFLVCAGILWATSTAVSQLAIEYSVFQFHESTMKASMILLYSAIGVIIGNIISIQLETKRWRSFGTFGILYSSIIFAFPFLAFSYIYTAILAFVIGVFFGICVNLIDAYYLKMIGLENKKEYGSSTYGLIVSVIIFISMMITSALNRHFSLSFSNFSGLLTSTIFNGIISILSIIYVIYYVYYQKKEKKM